MAAMTKEGILQALEGLSDDALIYVQSISYGEPSEIFLIEGYADKVTDKNLQNEITLIATR